MPQIKVLMSPLFALYHGTVPVADVIKAGRWDLVEDYYNDLKDAYIHGVEPVLPANIARKVSRLMMDLWSHIEARHRMETIYYFALIYEYLIIKITNPKVEELPEDIKSKIKEKLSLIKEVTLRGAIYRFEEVFDAVYDIVDILDMYAKYPHVRIAEYARKLIFFIDEKDECWTMYWSTRFFVRTTMVILGEEI